MDHNDDRLWTYKELMLDSLNRYESAVTKRIPCAACHDGDATVQLVGGMWKPQTVGSWVCGSCWAKTPERLADDIFIAPFVPMEHP